MKDVLAKLSPSERKILPHIEGTMDVNTLATVAGVSHAEAMRACQYLSNKGLATIESNETIEHALTKDGERARELKLPETRLLEAVAKKPRPMRDASRVANLEGGELNAAVGILKRAGAITMGQVIEKVGDHDCSALQEALESLDAEIPDELITRGLVERTRRAVHLVRLTATGKKISREDLDQEFEERLTPEMLKTGAWKDKTFRHYDVESDVPPLEYGREHFVSQAINHIKQLWLSMGFSEMKGTATQTAFWDLDVLYVPQDHPAREMQDTFYLPEAGTIREKDLLAKVKAVHENGGSTGSTGWQTSFSEEESKRVLLRIHTTALSARMLKHIADNDLSLPARYFSVAKVFRNETLDWKHLFEFHQVEGIVVGEDLTLADLIGLQRAFYEAMGFTDVRFRPAYFPYTEPSCEVEVYHPRRKQWIELGGMGVIRPEVTIPLLGRDIPVLAWGLGMERIITDYYDITDLRELYDNDLNRLREMKQFVPEWN